MIKLSLKSFPNELGYYFSAPNNPVREKTLGPDKNALLPNKGCIALL